MGINKIFILSVQNEEVFKRI